VRLGREPQLGSARDRNDASRRPDPAPWREMNSSRAALGLAVCQNRRRRGDPARPQRTALPAAVPLCAMLDAFQGNRAAAAAADRRPFVKRGW
jgi:hypothetical protein